MEIPQERNYEHSVEAAAVIKCTDWQLLAAMIDA